MVEGHTVSYSLGTGVVTWPRHPGECPCKHISKDEEYVQLWTGRLSSLL